MVDAVVDSRCCKKKNHTNRHLINKKKFSVVHSTFVCFFFLKKNLNKGYRCYDTFL